MGCCVVCGGRPSLGTTAGFGAVRAPVRHWARRVYHSGAFGQRGVPHIRGLLLSRSVGHIIRTPACSGMEPLYFLYALLLGSDFVPGVSHLLLNAVFDLGEGEGRDRVCWARTWGHQGVGLERVQCEAGVKGELSGAAAMWGLVCSGPAKAGSRGLAQGMRCALGLNAASPGRRTNDVTPARQARRVPWAV